MYDLVVENEKWTKKTQQSSHNKEIILHIRKFDYDSKNYAGTICYP